MFNWQYTRTATARFLVPLAIILVLVLTLPSATRAADPPAPTPTPSRPGALAPPYDQPVAVAFANSLQGWVITGDCQPTNPVHCGILGTTDGGRSWSMQHAGPLALTEIVFLDATNGWALGLGGAGCQVQGGECTTSLLATGDGGATWYLAGSAGERLTNLRFVDLLHGWALAEVCAGSGLASRCRNELRATIDGGATWFETITEGFSPTSLAFVDAERGWLAGWSCADPLDGGDCPAQVVATTDHGQTWTPQFAPPNIQYGVSPLVAFLNQQHGWLLATPSQNCSMSGCWGLLYRTLDGGLTWKEIQPAGAWHIDGQTRWQRGFPQTPCFINGQVGWMAIRAGGGSGVGGVAVTADGGSTWQRYGNTPGINVNMVAPLSGAEAWVVGHPPGGPTYLWHTSDGGRAWQQVLPPP